MSSRASASVLFFITVFLAGPSASTDRCERLLAEARNAESTVTAKEAEQLYVAAAQLSGSDISCQSHALRRLSALCTRYADVGDAARCAESVVSVADRHGLSQEALYRSITQLAAIYTDQKRYSDAERMWRRAVKIAEEDGPWPGVASQAHPLLQLAEVARAQGRFSEAEEAYKRVIALHERSDGPEAFGLIPPLDGLGALYMHQDRFDEAAEAYQHELRAFERRLGSGDSQALASLLKRYAKALSKAGRQDDAEAVSRRAEEMRRRIGAATAG